MKSSVNDPLGSWGLIPGDGLIVSTPDGVWVKELPTSNSPSWTARDLSLDQKLDWGVVLVVTNDKPKTAGIVGMTATGTKYVVTDIDIKLGAITVLTRGGS